MISTIPTVGPACNCNPSIEKPICPTSDYLKKMTTFDQVDSFLEGRDGSPFGGFDAIPDLANKDGVQWRLVRARNAELIDGKYVVKKIDGKVCNTTILLKSIVNKVNEVLGSQGISLTQSEGYRPVVIVSPEDVNPGLLARVEGLVAKLNTYSR